MIQQEFGGGVAVDQVILNRQYLVPCGERP